MINLNLWASLVVFFLAWAHPSPRIEPRLRQISAAAAEIASTDATEDEARKLARIVTHESSIRPNARGPAGEVGLFQIMPPSKGGYGAREALRRLRWSEGTCGDLSLYAGCGKCGACPRGLLDELEHAGDPPPQVEARADTKCRRWVTTSTSALAPGCLAPPPRQRSSSPLTRHQIYLDLARPGNLCLPCARLHSSRSKSPTNICDQSAW